MSERLEICVGILREPYPYHQDSGIVSREGWEILSYAKNCNKLKTVLWDTPNGLFLEERDPEKRKTQVLHRVEPGGIEEVLEKLGGVKASSG